MKKQFKVQCSNNKTFQKEYRTDQIISIRKKSTQSVTHWQSSLYRLSSERVQKIPKQYTNNFRQQFFKIMCKITFSHIKDGNSLGKGLFQLIDDDEFSQTHIQERSTDHSENNSEESLEDAKARKSFEIQRQILDWFKDKHIFSGNPEDLIYKSVQRQKAIILPKKTEVNGLYGNKVKMNNLLSRRAAKLIEVNVSG